MPTRNAREETEAAKRHGIAAYNQAAGGDTRTMAKKVAGLVRTSKCMNSTRDIRRATKKVAGLV